MSWKLSKSACAKYLQCPASFDYFYLQNIRPIKVGSPLVFGNGIDEALNSLLLKTNQLPLKVYRDSVAKTPLGKMVPNKYDFDSDLLTDTHRKELLITLVTFGYKGTDVDGLYLSLLDKYNSGEELSENQAKALDFICRAVLEVKAYLFFKAYEIHVLPLIEKTHNVQKRTGAGYLDATVDWKTLGKRILDHKTSGRPYPNNSIDYSLQLAMYANEEQIFDVTYVVFIKAIKKHKRKICVECGHVGKGSHKTCDNEIEKKRCNGEWEITIDPEAEIQILHGEITPEAINVAKEVPEQVRRAVDAKAFPCNFEQCNSQFGKPCEYRNLKWKGSMEGLEIVERKTNGKSK